MSEDLSKLTSCVLDHGLFFGLAQELARPGGFGRVLYHPLGWEKAFSSIRDGGIGAGFDEVEHCLDFYPLMDQIDVFVCPDIGHSGLQRNLLNQGKLVWGGCDSDELELDREYFLQVLKGQGLDVPQYEVVEGLTELRSYLDSHEHHYIKISRWRGDLDTFEYLNDKLSRGDLDAIANRLGPFQDELPFLVFKPIKTKIEAGYDGYDVKGQFPVRSMQGPEIKDKVYLGAMCEYSDLPEPVRKVNEAFRPILANYGCAQFWSTEIRIKGKQAFFIDPTRRLGLPSGDAQLKAYANLPQIIWEGANGRMLDPEPEYSFIAQALIDHKDDKMDWRYMEIPDDVYPWVRLMRPCKRNGIYAICPNENGSETVGSVLGGGESIEDAIDHCQENAAKISHNPVEIHLMEFADALREIAMMEDKGLPFSDDEVPEPSIVVEA